MSENKTLDNVITKVLQENPKILEDAISVWIHSLAENAPYNHLTGLVVKATQGKIKPRHIQTVLLNKMITALSDRK